MFFILWGFRYWTESKIYTHDDDKGYLKDFIYITIQEKHTIMKTNCT